MADLAIDETTEVIIRDSTDHTRELKINSDGSLDAGLRTVSNVVSAGNSTTTVLGISGVFTGAGEDVLSYATITIITRSDVASATDGLSVEFSSDGTNWDSTDNYSIAANSGKIFSVGVMARYFRVRYTNGTSAQTSFRLQTIYHLVNIKPSSHEIVKTITGDDDAELVKAVLAGENNQQAGSFLNVKVENGRLLVSQESVTPSTGTTIVQTTFGSVATTSGIDTNYTITNGKTLTIQVLNGGAEESTGGSIIELFEDPNGTLSPLNRIDSIFVNSETNSIAINQDFTGDGTRRIVMRRRGYTGAPREMSARWRGFEV